VPDDGRGTNVEQRWLCVCLISCWGRAESPHTSACSAPFRPQKKKVKEVSHEWQLVNKQKPIWMRNPEVRQAGTVRVCVCVYNQRV
jgi:hypothetical protein